MKRMLPILLVLAILFALLVSCEGKEKETATATAEETVEETAGTPAETAPTTTTKKRNLTMGIPDQDIGWDWNN